MQTQQQPSSGFESAAMQFDADTSAQTQSIYQSHYSANAVPQALNRAVLITFFGAVDVDTMQMALSECTRRHEALRARLQTGGERWLIDPEAQTPFKLIKGDPVQIDKTETALMKLVDQTMLNRIDLHKGPLWKATMVQLDPNTYVLLLVCHRILGDIDTLCVLTKELTENYQMFSGTGSPELSISVEGLDSTPQTAPRSTEYWLKKQNRGIITSQLPDMKREMPEHFNASRVDLTIDQTARQTLIKLADTHQCTLNDVLICALAVLIKRLNPDAPVAVHCRPQLKTGQLRSDQIATSVPIDVDLNLSGSETLKIVADTLAQASKHPIFNAKKLEKTSSKDIFQPVAVSFGLVRIPSEKALTFGQTPGQVMTVRATHTTSPFDLSVLDDGETLRLECEFQPESFAEQSIVNWLGAYRALLIALARESRLPAGVLEILDPRHEALIEEYSTGASSPAWPRNTLISHMSKLAQQLTGQIAIASESWQLSWLQCESRSNQIARSILAKGIQPGQTVVLQLDDTILSFVVAIACLKAQVPFVNLSVKLEPQDQDLVSSAVDAQLLVTNSVLTTSPLWRDKPVLKLDAEHEQIAALSSAPLTDIAQTDSSAAWYEISIASTNNKPVCIPVPWVAVSNLIAHGSTILEMGANDRAVCLADPITGSDLACALASFSGGATVLLPSAITTASSAALHQFMSDLHATAMLATPGIWQMVVDAQTLPKGLKVIVHGTGLTEELAEQLISGAQQFRRTVGCPETGFLNVANVVDSVDAFSEIGRPQPNTQLRILDERAQPCPIGAVGELLIGGPCVSGHYLDAALLSSQHFVLDQFGETPGAQLFRTGITCAWRANGSIRVVDEE